MPSHSLVAGDRPRAVRFSRDGRVLAIATDVGVELWSTESAKRSHTIALGRKVDTLAFSDDSRVLVAVGSTHREPVAVLDVREGSVRCQPGVDVRPVGAALFASPPTLILTEKRDLVRFDTASCTQVGRMTPPLPEGPAPQPELGPSGPVVAPGDRIDPDVLALGSAHGMLFVLGERALLKYTGSLDTEPVSVALADARAFGVSRDGQRVIVQVEGDLHLFDGVLRPRGTIRSLSKDDGSGVSIPRHLADLAIEGETVAYLPPTTVRTEGKDIGVPFFEVARRVASEIPVPGLPRSYDMAPGGAYIATVARSDRQIRFASLP